MEKDKIINDNELENVTGGVVGAAYTKLDDGSGLSRKQQFENAWAYLDLENMGISGMQRAQLFDEWERSGFKLDAIAFLEARS